jgi:multicomponent Na+:H+ antiporter subunit D
VIGVFPEAFYQLLPYPVDYAAYEPGKVLFYLQLLLFSGLAFFLLLPLMKRTLTISLDTDWLWRVVFFRAGTFVYDVAGRVGNALGSVAKAGASLARVRPKQGLLSELLSGAQPIATTALWIAMLLTGYVLAYYF